MNPTTREKVYKSEQEDIAITTEQDELTGNVKVDVVSEGNSAQAVNTVMSIEKSEAEQQGREIESSVEYSTNTPNQALAAYEALGEGYTRDEIHDFVGEEVYNSVVSGYLDKAEQAESEGYSKEEIKEFLASNTDVPVTKKVEKVPYKSIPELSGMSFGTSRQEEFKSVIEQKADTAKDLVSSMKVIKPVLTSDLLTTIPAYFGDKEAAQKYNVARLESRRQIQQMAMEKYNLPLEWYGDEPGTEKWYMFDGETKVEVTPEFLDDFQKSTGELVGGLSGAVAGAKITPPTLGPKGKLAGAAIGGIFGAVVGSEFDYLRQAINLQEDFEAEALAYRSMNAAELGVVAEVIGYGAMKSIGTGWKSLLKAKDVLIDGNTEGAYAALKETTFLSDSEIQEIVTKLEKHIPLEGSSEQKAIQAIALTEPGMQELVRAASSTDALAGRAVIDAIDSRAKDVLESTANISEPTAAIRFVSDLSNYTDDVKNLYRKVKARATQAPKGKDFTWDYDSTAINPVLESLYAKIADPTVKAKFLNQAERIRSFTDSRNFGDLIEMRQIVNDFLFNKRVVKIDDRKTLREVLNTIDSQIEEAAPNVVENGEQWLKDWSSARTEYSQMKQLEKTAMYKLIFDKNGTVKPVQPEAVTKALTKYITALDGSFEEVLDKLPPKSRKVYEGTILDVLTNKYTAGSQGDLQAINFPLLADELKKVKLISPEARAVKSTLLEMGEVFKNDIPLAQTNTAFSVPKFQSYLTTDPVVRAKFEMASTFFNTVKTWMPTQEQRTNALIKQTAKLLEKPMDRKLAEELIAEYRQSPEMLRSISKMQREAAWAQANEKSTTAAKVNLFGNGKVLKLEGSGEPTQVPIHRIATTERVQEILDSEAIPVNSKMIDDVLKQYGYIAVQQGSDRVRVL